MDAVWVVGSYALIFLVPFRAGGKWVVALVAELVLAFAILQWLGIRRVRKSTTSLNSAGWPIPGVRDTPSPMMFNDQRCGGLL